MWKRARELLQLAPDLEEAGVAEEEEEEEEDEERALLSQMLPRKGGDAAEAGPFPLLELPMELILAVFEYLTVPDLNAVRAAGCRLLTALANDPSLWHAFYNRHRRYAGHSAVGSMVHIGEAEEDDGGCWRGSQGVDRADVKRFGWRQLAITLMKRRCFQCGAQPSFVVFLDNTRKCQKCICTEKLRREVEETKRWEHELKHQQPQPSEDEGNELGEDVVEQQAKRMKTTLCTDESRQKRRAVKVSRRLTRLGALLGEAGKHADGETLLLEVLARDLALHGERSLVVANDYHNLAHLCRLRSNTFVYVRDEKIKICRRGMGYIAEALRVYNKYLAQTVVRHHNRCMPAGESNELLLRIGDCLCMLAGYLCTTSTHLTFAHKLDAEQSALRLLEKAMAVYVKMGDGRGLAEAYRISAGIFADTHHQDKAKAIDYLQRSLALVDKIFGRESVQAADIMQKFGYMYWNWDRESVAGLEKSLEWHQKELEIRGSVMGLTHPITKRTREDIYIILDRLGRLPEARELYAGLPPEEGEHAET